MKRFLIAAFAGALLATGAYADERHHKDAKADTLAEGEVRRVDKAAKRITIKHGPLEKLEMPPMTMAFQVKDPALLTGVKEGDRIRFDAERIAGKLTVMRIEPAK
jgi:Cu/Ag efflux protein CusF